VSGFTAFAFVFVFKCKSRKRFRGFPTVSDRFHLQQQHLHPIRQPNKSTCTSSCKQARPAANQSISQLQTKQEASSAWHRLGLATNHLGLHPRPHLAPSLDSARSGNSHCLQVPVSTDHPYVILEGFKSQFPVFFFMKTIILLCWSIWTIRNNLHLPEFDTNSCSARKFQV